ncbi:MAG: hypothetical protein ACO225_10510 [Ilumatobacteraceae bacterium]
MRLTSESLAVVVSVSVVMGLAAALVGGPLTGLGSGFGGLYGLPAMIMLLIAVGIAIPAAVVTARRAGRLHRRLGAAAVIAGGAWVVAIGYSSVAHAVDPCLNGWWDAASHIGDQPLCERFGNELNWHSRFHLLAHAVPAAVLLAAYLWSVVRWARPGVDAHARSRTDPSASRGQVGVGSDRPR